MAADESADAYAARLAAFLSTQPGKTCALGSVGNDCRWAQAVGVPGAYARLLRARPALFALSSDGHRVTLVGYPPQQQQQRGGGDAAERAYERRVADFLRAAGGSAYVAQLAQRCPWDQLAGRPGAYARFLRSRPALFELSRDGNTVVLLFGRAGGAPPAAAAAAGSASTRAFEQLLVGFLQRRGGTAPYSSLGGLWSQKPAGITGSFMQFLDARPALFRVQGDDVSLAPATAARQPAPPPPPPPYPPPPPPPQQQRQQQQRPPPPPPETAGQYAARLAAFLAQLPDRRLSIGVIGNQCPWPAAVGKPGAYRQLVQSRSDLFGYERVPHGTEYVTLVSQPAEELGVRLTGPTELRSAPNSAVVATFALSRDAAAGGAPLRARDARVTPQRADCTVALLYPGAALPAGGAIAVQLSHRPTTSLAARVAVVVTLQAPDGAWCTAASEHCLLRCADAAADDPVLRPSAPFQRAPRRRPRPDTAYIPGVKLPHVTARMPRLPDVRLEQSLIDALAEPAGAPHAALLRRLAAPLGPATHAARFRELLLCEEAQQLTDIREYDMESAALRRRGDGAFLLGVPGLLEGRPSVMRGDSAVATRTAGQTFGWQGVVHEVARDTLALRFDPRFDDTYAPGATYHVRFRLSRAPMLLAHAAVTAAAELPPALLFPRAPPPLLEVAAAAAVAAAALPRTPYHRELNERQQQAVVAALQPDADGAPYVIFGPPGTGKTTTVVELIQQLLHRAGAGGGGGMLGGVLGAFRSLSLGVGAAAAASTLVLLAAPSNAACDVAATRLLTQGLPPSELLRINAFSRDVSQLPPKLRDCSVTVGQPEATQLPGRVRVVAMTCITAQRVAQAWQAAGVRGGVFTHIVVDEAGQATEPEALCAVTRLLRPGGRLVLAGDPRQLGPVLRSRLAQAHGLGISLLERLTESGPHSRRPDRAAHCADGWHPAYVTQLNQNYRSHQALLTVPNALFYAGSLRACADRMRANAFANWDALPERARAVAGGFPLLFRGVEGLDEREANSPSWFNAIEAAAVLDLVQRALAHRGAGVTPKDVGVITPYAKQVGKIRKLLEKRGLSDVDVGSVEQFQGQERTVIILSTVRSSLEHAALDAQQALGFLSNPKRFNVAVTRARSLLCVVGNPAVLARDPCWAALLRHALRHGAYEGCAPPDLGDGDEGNPLVTGEDEAHVATVTAALGQVSLQEEEEAPGWRRDNQ